MKKNRKLLEGPRTYWERSDYSDYRNAIKEEILMRKILVDATKKTFDGDLAKHEANLEVYLNNSAGVGEHSDIIGEIKELVQKIHDAKGCIEILNGGK